jgi:hypothetical protein
MPRRSLYAVGLTALAAVAAWAAWPPDTPTPAKPVEYDLTATAADAIAPGTVIEPKNHPGWSDLVLKSQPRIRQDQVAKVNDLTARMAGWMITAFLADVQKADTPAGPRYKLRAVGLGLGSAVKGKDVVFTADTAEKVGADVGFVTRSILNKGYEVQQKAKVVLRGPTFWLVDTPVWFAVGGKHQLVRYRYGLLVDEATGKLDVLLWRVGSDGTLGGNPPQAVWLNPEAVDKPNLVVDANEITIGIPSEAAFAVDRLPGAGAAVGIAADLRKLAGQAKFTAPEAASLEAGLRKITGGR